MTQDLDKIIDRVRKLHAKAESCKEIGSIEEAATFAAAVEKMLATHKLTMSQLEIEQEEIEDPISKSYVDPNDWGLGKKQQRVAWQEFLATGVARAHFCRILVIPGSNKVVFVGRGADREVAIFMWVTLVRKCEELAKAAYAAYWKRTKVQNLEPFQDGYVANFKQGFVRAVNERYQEIERQRQYNAKTTGTSLVRLDDAHKAVSTWIKQNTRSGSAGAVGGSSTHNSAGARDGHRAGSSVSLTGSAVKGGSNTTAARVGSGQRLLGGK